MALCANPNLSGSLSNNTCEIDLARTIESIIDRFLTSRSIGNEINNYILLNGVGWGGGALNIVTIGKLSLYRRFDTNLQGNSQFRRYALGNIQSIARNFAIDWEPEVVIKATACIARMRITSAAKSRLGVL